MRILTQEEKDLSEKLDDKKLTEEEREKIVEKLKQIELEVTNGMTWLT